MVLKRTLLAGILAGSGGGGAQLRAISPTNTCANADGATTTGTKLNTISDMPIYIGSGNVTGIVLSWFGWNYGASGFVANANDFTVVSASLKTSAKTASTAVNFSGGRSKVITAGVARVDSDVITAASLGFGTFFPRNTKLWLRQMVSVAAAGLKVPLGAMNYTTVGYPAAVGLDIDPATYNGGVDLVDSTSGANLPTSTGTSNNFPFMPVVLGYFASGDPPTIFGAGDSIVHGTGDGGTATPVIGGFSRALFGDGSTNIIGGINFSRPGAGGQEWTAAGFSLPAAYIPTCKHGFEEYGTNSFLSGGTLAGPAETISSNIWALYKANGIGQIVKPLLVPRTTSTDSWATTTFQSPLNTSWQTGGGARQFNADMRALVGTSLFAVAPLNALRSGTTEGTDAFYQWFVNGTANYSTTDGIHPTLVQHQAQATEYQSIFATLP